MDLNPLRGLAKLAKRVLETITGKPEARMEGYASAKPKQLSVSHVSLNEQRLDADEFAVKRKLGKSWFTRRLNPATRYQRLGTLTRDEYALALRRGWIA